MITIPYPENFDSFREVARPLLAENIAPHKVMWCNPKENSFLPIFKPVVETATSSFKISEKLIGFLKTLSLYRDDNKWQLIYSILYRGKQSGFSFLSNPADGDVIQANLMAKQIKRDIHKMHAFVRFRSFQREGREVFIAWHVPDHLILETGAKFFVKRFASMEWSIYTPDGAAHWNLSRLKIEEGKFPPPPATQDQFETWWEEYYRSIFNPARLKISAMLKEMPRRHWKTLPETKLIPELISTAAGRIDKMKIAPPKAEPPKCHDLESLSRAGKSCTACSLACSATQTVFGTGKTDARIMVIGEQPGDEEDLAGEPFIGPAGQLLTSLFERAGVKREEVYLTNAVKHFKFELRGKRRLHKTPSGRDLLACKPWLDEELRLVDPKVIVCLGASAGQSILGRKVSVKENLYAPFTLGSSTVLVTYHPAAALRAPNREALLEIENSIVSALAMASYLSSANELLPLQKESPQFKASLR